MAQKPKIAFVGLGWIGRNRMEALVNTNCIECAALHDVSGQAVQDAVKLVPGARVAASIGEAFNGEADAVVIATPSALHAEQATAALSSSKAVFCQKPVGRDREETLRVVEAARKYNRLLGVDFSYRHAAGMMKIKELFEQQALGNVYAMNLVFHNAYGPDKSWFYDPKLSGGGCLVDLGSHLIDLALWLNNFPDCEVLERRIFCKGKPLQDRHSQVEDFVSAQLLLNGRITVNLQCSWNLSLGKDAHIELTAFGTEGGASFKNVGGSFYDFKAEHYRNTSTETLASPPDDWGGRAICHWAGKLAQNRGYDPEADHLINVAEVIDRIYEG